MTKSLCDEVQGYGGGNCVKNVQITIKGKCIICPNSAFAREVEKIVNYILSKFNDCPATVTPGTPPTYTLPGGTQIYITPTPGQGTGGMPPAPQAIPTKVCPIVSNCYGTIDTYKHDYLCVDQKCAGLMPDQMYCGEDGGGMITIEDFNQAQCVQLWIPDCCDYCVYAACVERLSWGSLGTCGKYDYILHNCITWANDVHDTCKKEACGE